MANKSCGADKSLKVKQFNKKKLNFKAKWQRVLESADQNSISCV